MNLKKAERRAYTLLEELKITQPEVPVDRIARELKIKLVIEKLDKDVSGFLYKNDKENEYIICVNEDHSLNRRRFTIAHELGHFLLHNNEHAHIDREFSINFRNSISSQAIKSEEIEANAFAAALLMPEELLIPAILDKIENGIDLVESDEIKEIAKKFIVSEQALCFRLGKLGYL